MGKCRFNDNWLDDEKYSGWLQKTTEYEVRCRLCKKTIQLGTMGCRALDAHMKGEKHKRYADSQATTVPIQMFAASVSTSKANVTPALVSSGPSTSNAFGTFSPTTTLKAKMLWVLHTVSRHHSYTSNEDVSTVFRAMSADSECAKTFSCGRDETSYLARFGLVPYIKRELLSIVNQGSFVLMFDESMNRTTRAERYG